jgi:hypothetical protein
MLDLLHGILVVLDVVVNIIYKTALSLRERTTKDFLSPFVDIVDFARKY